MPSCTRWSLACPALCLLLLVGACASAPEPRDVEEEILQTPPAQAPTYGGDGPPTLVFASFKWVEEVYSAGGSANVTTTALIFSHRDKEIAMVHRGGYEGRSVVKGLPGKKISLGRAMQRLAGAKCARVFGDSCNTNVDGKCLDRCKANMTVIVHKPKLLAACLKASADPLVSRLYKEGEGLLRLKLDSPCVFLHGEGLVLEEE